MGIWYYPYLLKDMDITRPNQVWCADITYIPMRKGFLYLVAMMDWATRKENWPGEADVLARTLLAPLFSSRIRISKAIFAGVRGMSTCKRVGFGEMREGVGRA